MLHFRVGLKHTITYLLYIVCIGKNRNAFLKAFIKKFRSFWTKFAAILVLQFIVLIIDAVAINYLIGKTVAIN